jgi:hypothetical protein
MVVVEATPVGTLEAHAMSLDFDAEVGRLAARLERGIEVIDAARAAGRDVRAWEDAWIQLLTEYESLVDRRAA